MQNSNKLIIGAIIGVVIIMLLLAINPFVQIESGERGVVTTWGKVQDDIMQEGLHFRMPIAQDVHKMDIKIKKYEVSELSYSKDAQIVDAAVTLNYSLEPAFVKQVFTEVRKDYESIIITPAIKEVIKSTIAKYTAQGLLDNRPQVRIDIQTTLTKQLSIRGIRVEEVSITNLDFDDAYETAVREKQVAEQEALKQANITKSESEKKDQEILKAQALAEKTRLEAQALASQQGEKVINKIYAEAALEAAKKWNGTLPTHFVPGSTLPILNLQTQQ